VESALIICQLFSCVSVLCGLDRSICSVAGDVIVGADGIFGYISFLAEIVRLLADGAIRIAMVVAGLLSVPGLRHVGAQHL
jgi:hypothetical protein